MTNENKLGTIANLILVMLMSSSISLTLYSSLFMTNRVSWIIFLSVVPFTLLFFVMFRSRLSTFVSLIFLLAVSIGTLIYIIFYTGVEGVLIWTNKYSIWFIDLVNGYRNIEFQLFNDLTILAITGVVTLFVFIVTIKFYNFYVTAVLFFSIFFVQLQLSITGSKLSYLMFLLSFLLYYFFYILQRRSVEKTYYVGNKLKYLLNIVPVCFVVIGVTFLFPINPDRVAIPWLDKKIDTAFEKVINRFSGVDVSSFDYFSFGVTGFGKSDRLGGNLKLNKTHIMDVQAEHTNLYLRGTSKANYDGHRWYNDDMKLSSLGDSQYFLQQISKDTANFINGLGYSGGIITDFSDNAYFKKSKANISYVNLNTKSLFIPVKAYNLLFKSKYDLSIDSEQMLSTKTINGEDFSYTIEYLSLKLKDEELINLLRKNSEISDKTAQLNNLEPYTSHVNSSTPILLQSIDNKDKQSIINEAPDSSLKSMQEKYTQLPDTITDRVKQLAKDITKDKHNQYDMAKAIENYLSQNYPYTLTPGNPPRSRDFVDYFLFEGKKGYCTYYASAMTILLRSLDIPSRFVEGYILPPAKEKGVYKVTNQQAHAWVEVYFKDFGWIPFEPTSPFVANLYDDRSISATISNDMMSSNYQEYIDMMNAYRNQSAGLTFEIPSTPTKEKSIEKPILILIIASSVLIFIILIITTIFSINYFRFYNLQRRIKKGDPNTSIFIAYNYILKALKYIGVNIMPGETPTQFGERIEKFYDLKSFSFNKTSFTNITGLYVKARYSQAKLNEKDIAQTLDFINVLGVLIQEKTSKLRYILAHYFLGRI